MFGCYLHHSFVVSHPIDCTGSAGTNDIQTLQTKVTDYVGIGPTDMNFFCGACGGSSDHLYLDDCIENVKYLNQFAFA